MISDNDLLVEAFKCYPNDSEGRQAFLRGVRRGVELYGTHLERLVRELELQPAHFDADFPAEAAHTRGFSEARYDARTRVSNVAAIVMGNASQAMNIEAHAMVDNQVFGGDNSTRRIVGDIAELIMRKVRP